MIEHSADPSVLRPPPSYKNDNWEERQLAASLAHNVNNLLTGVIGNLELGLQAAPGGTPVRYHLNCGLQGACQIAGLVRRIVQFALRSSRPLEGQRISLRRMALLAAAGSEQSAKRQGIQVALEGDAPGWVIADAALFHDVLDHLMANALEAAPQNGLITLRVWDEADQTHLSISDNGSGLTSEARDHLFEPFFTTKNCGHLGLGLVLCKEIIEANGGSIRVTSISGQGTTITLVLPLADAQARDSNEKQVHLQKQAPQPAYREPHSSSLAAFENRQIANV